MNDAKRSTNRYFVIEAKESLAWQLGALVSNGKFLEAVSFEKSPLTLILTQLKSEVDGKGIDAHDVVLKLRDLIEDYLTMGTATAEKHLALVYAAIASLMIFVQGNFTGPPFEGEIAVSPVRPYLSFLNPFFPQTPFLKHLKLDFMLTILNVSDSSEISATFHQTLILRSCRISNSFTSTCLSNHRSTESLIRMLLPNWPSMENLRTKRRSICHTFFWPVSSCKTMLPTSSIASPSLGGLDRKSVV